MEAIQGIFVQADDFLGCEIASVKRFLQTQRIGWIDKPQREHPQHIGEFNASLIDQYIDLGDLTQHRDTAYTPVIFLMRGIRRGDQRLLGTRQAASLCRRIQRAGVVWRGWTAKRLHYLRA